MKRVRYSFYPGSFTHVQDDELIISSIFLTNFKIGRTILGIPILLDSNSEYFSEVEKVKA